LLRGVRHQDSGSSIAEFAFFKVGEFRGCYAKNFYGLNGFENHFKRVTNILSNFTHLA
jgi:hypothetical protein